MIAFCIFIFGLFFGSFLDVLIDRIPIGKSVIYGRSVCEFCNHTLAFYDLIPVVSFLFLRGTCRYCHKKLSLQYPLIELVSGFLFVCIYFLEMPMSPLQISIFAIDVLLASLGLVLTIIDIKHRILPDKLLIVFGALCLLRFVLDNPFLIINRFEVALLSMLPLLLIFLFTKGKGMGFGDVKLIFVLGFLLGFPRILFAYYVAFLTGGVVGVILILRRKKSFHKATIAFGPFLFIGAAVASIWGDILWKYAKVFIGF